MDLQFVLKDKFRLAVIEDLSGGEQSIERITKKNHLPAPAVDRAVRELMAEDIVGGPGSSLYLTDKGKEMLARIKGMEHISGGGADPKARSRIPDRLGPEDSRKRKENQGT
jgi:predicted transcriptional regulator